ncbi:MAG: hypothetical protein PW843_17920 [Azospirillaceae bacterium]|nr:hypothetical protein [Azospirillaceae bacterium]
MTFTFDDFKARFFPGPAVPDGSGSARGPGARPARTPDHIDGIPLSAILAAIKADPAALDRRREVLEGEIRSLWSTLQGLVREYRTLTEDAVGPQGIAPTLPAASLATAQSPREMADVLAGGPPVPPRVRSMVRPARSLTR